MVRPRPAGLRLMTSSGERETSLTSDLRLPEATSDAKPAVTPSNIIYPSNSSDINSMDCLPMQGCVETIRKGEREEG